MEAFDPPKDETVRVKDLIHLKVQDFSDKGKDHRSIVDITGLNKHFSEWMDLPVSKVTPELLGQKYASLLKTEIHKGGDGKTTGLKKIMAPRSARNFIVRLSSCFSLAVSKGLITRNVCLDFLKTLGNS